MELLEKEWGLSQKFTVVQHFANAVSMLKFPIKSSRVSYKLGMEQTVERAALGGWTKLNHWCGSKEIQLCKMSRYSSSAGMECDSELHQVLSGPKNMFQGTVIIKGKC